MPTTRHKGALLVVDDVPQVRRALRRYFARYFDAVLSARNRVEAEAVLSEAPVVALLCDYWLGDGSRPTTSLIPDWRAAHPSIRRVALMTGTRTGTVGDAPGVDALFRKPFDLAAVRDFLLAP